MRSILIIVRLVFVLLLSLPPAAHGQPVPPGRIVFSASSPGPAVSRYELTNKSDLFIGVSLRQPLAAYLKELAPALTADSLAKTGNYQFSFFVDERLVYRTELLPGAPRPAQQQQDTTWNKPLIDNAHEGAWWSQSAWNRFMYNGGDSALTDGQHAFRLELRPYVKSPDLRVGEIIAEGRLDLTVKRKPVIDRAHTRLSAVKPYPGLPVSAAALNRDKIKALRAYVDANVFRHISSVVVLKEGKILVEEYFNGSGRDSLHDVRSVGKSFASALTGMAIRDGYLRSANERLDTFYDLRRYKNYSAAKAGLRLDELLTMSSRFDGDDDDPASPGNEENMYPTDDWVRFTLDLPLDTVKYRGQWHYFTAGVMLLGSILNTLIPGGLERYADRRLFQPLGIRNYRWQYTPQQAPSLAGGIRINSLDFAKFGQLYANGGRWNGREVLPAAWVEKTLSRQLPITGRTNEYYGYLFWNKMYHAGGRAYEAYYCSGNGGNKIVIIRELKLVVVITATAYGAPYGHVQADRILEEFVLEAVAGR